MIAELARQRFEEETHDWPHRGRLLNHLWDLGAAWSYAVDLAYFESQGRLIERTLVTVFHWPAPTAAAIAERGEDDEALEALATLPQVAVAARLAPYALSPAEIDQWARAEIARCAAKVASSAPAARAAAAA